MDIIGKSSEAFRYISDYDIHIAIGNNKTREKIQSQLETAGATIPILIHPSAVIGENVELGKGTVVMAGVVINCCSRIGKGCIVNTSVTIEHDNVIEDYAQISTGAHIAGTVRIGRNAWIGIGVVIVNNINITSECIVGAGAVVVRDIIETGTYVGIPARKIKQKS